MFLSSFLIHKSNVVFSLGPDSTLGEKRTEKIGERKYFSYIFVFSLFPSLRSLVQLCHVINVTLSIIVNPFNPF